MSDAIEVLADAPITIAPEAVANASTETDTTILPTEKSLNSTSLSSVESSFASLGFMKTDKPLTVSKIFWSCAINLFLPFINGMMLGFGEIFAHELGFRWGWSAARVSPSHRMKGPPGVEVINESEKPSNRRLLMQS